MFRYKGLIKNKDETISRNIIYKNLFVVSFAIFFLYSAYLPLQDLLTSLYKEGNLGVVSLFTIYSGMGLGNIFVSVIVLKLFGTKKTMVISTCAYLLFIFANFYGIWWTFIPSSLILGLCDGPLWCAAASYIKELSNRHARNNNVSADDIFAKFYAMFFGIFKMSQICGNVVSSKLLSFSRNKSNWTSENTSCGASFCPVMKLPEENLGIEPFNLTILICISVVFVCIAFVLLLLLLDRVENSEEKINVIKTELFISTFKEMRNVRMILLIPSILFSGLQCGIVYSDLTEAYVTCYIGVDMIGWMMCTFGLFSFLSSIAYSVIAKYIGSFSILVGATIVQIALFIWLLKWELLVTNSLDIYLICAALYGACDAAWRSQTIIFAGNLYSTKTDQIFALVEFWKAIGFTISFAYGPLLCVNVKIYIAIGIMSLGTLLCGIVNYWYIKPREGWKQIDD